MENSTFNTIKKYSIAILSAYILSSFIFGSLINLNDGKSLGASIVNEFKRIGMPIGFEVNNFNLIEMVGGGRTLSTRFYTNNNIEDVKKYYQDNLAKNGWIATSKEGVYTKNNLELKIHFFNNYWSIDVYPK